MRQNETLAFTHRHMTDSRFSITVYRLRVMWYGEVKVTVKLRPATFSRVIQTNQSTQQGWKLQKSPSTPHPHLRPTNVAHVASSESPHVSHLPFFPLSSSTSWIFTTANPFHSSSSIHQQQALVVLGGPSWNGSLRGRKGKWK
jgi:hypothetical protein